MEKQEFEKLDGFFKSKVGAQNKAVKAYPSGAKSKGGKLGLAHKKLANWAKDNFVDIVTYSTALLSSGLLTVAGASLGVDPAVVALGASAGGGLITAGASMWAMASKSKKER